MKNSWTAGLQRFWSVEPLHRRMVHGAVWSLVGAAFANGLTMASNVAVARLLGAEHFGELAIILSTTNLFTALFASGLGMTATKYVAEFRDSHPQRAGSIIGLSSITSLLFGAATALPLAFLSPWISRTVLGSSKLSEGLSLGAAAMFFAALNGSQIGVLTGLEAFRRVAWGNLVRGCAIILLVTVGALWDGVTGALLGYMAAGAACAIFYQIALRKECDARSIPISYCFKAGEMRILYRFTLPLLVSTFCFTPAAWWCNVLLVNRYGLSEAGVFNAVLNWQMLILFFTSAVSNVGLPMLSNVRAERDSTKYRKCLALNCVLTSAPAVMIAIPVALFSPFIMRLYGSAFEHGAAALALISVAAVLSAINSSFGPALWSLEASLPAVMLSLFRGATLVVSAYAFVGAGSAGLAWAYILMGLVQTTMNVPFMAFLIKRDFTAVTGTERVAA